jgi:hypothetical protein
MKATRLGPMLAECTAGEAQPACRDGSKDSRGDLLVCKYKLLIAIY